MTRGGGGVVTTGNLRQDEANEGGGNKFFDEEKLAIDTDFDLVFEGFVANDRRGNEDKRGGGLRVF